MAQAAAEGKSANAGSGNTPARHCQTKDMRGMIDITPRVTSSNAHRFRLGINLHIADEREVDDQAIITDSQPSGIVASAPYGNQEIVLARKLTDAMTSATSAQYTIRAGCLSIMP